MGVNRKYGGIVWGTLSLVIVFVGSFCLKVDGLSVLQLRAFALLIAFTVTLVGNVLPVIQVSMLILCLIPVLGISTDLSMVFGGFSNSVVFFILASFGIASAFSKVPLTKRLLRKMLCTNQSNSKSILLALMICTALTSSIMSNVPTCVIFMTIALQFLKLYDKEEERRQTGKAYMLGVTFASMIGGMLTPAGSSINILAIHLLEQSEGISIPFGTWMCIAFPVVIVVLPIAWFLVIKIIGTAPVTVDRKKQFLDELNVGKKIGADEWKVMAILLIMVILWIASSWMPQINVVVVALVGCVVLQIPKVGVITSEEFVKAINVDAIFIVATVLSLGNIIVSAGLGDFINKIELPFAGIWQVLFLVAFMVFGGLVLIPIAPSLITVLIPLIISLGNDRVSPAALVITCALCACNCYFIPLDTVCLITYGQGYYSMSDMPKVSVFLQIWVAFTVSLCVTVFVIMAKI